MTTFLSTNFRKYKNLIGVALLTLVNVLGFSILIPVLPFIVLQYGATNVTYGFLLSIYSVCQFIAAPYLGALSDKFGRKPILLFSQLGTFLSWILFALAWFLPNYKLLNDTVFLSIAQTPLSPNIDMTLTLNLSLPILVISISRILDGITGGNAAVTNAYLSDVTPHTKKVKYFGAITAVFGLGFLIGPVLGSYSSATPIGYLGTVIVAGIISLITLIFIKFFVSESLPEEERDAEVKIDLKKELNIWARIRKFKHNRTLTNLFILWFFYSMAYAAFITIIILHIIEIFSLSEKEVGNMMLIVGVALILNQLLIAKFVSPWLKEMRLLRLGLIFSVIGLIGMSLTTNLWLFLTAAAIFGLGFSGTMPTLKALFAHAVNKNQQGEVMGIDQSLESFTLAVAPLTSTIIYSFIAGWTFQILAVLVLIPLIIYVQHYKEMKSVIEERMGGEWS